MAIRVQIEEQKSGIVEYKIFASDYQVYVGHCFPWTFALLRLARILEHLFNFPVSIKSRAEIETNLIGRKVYWREWPAIVQDFDGLTGKVTLRPQPPSRTFISEPWDRELGAGYTMTNGWIKEDLLSPKIYWFRETDENPESSATDSCGIGAAEKTRS